LDEGLGGGGQVGYDPTRVVEGSGGGAGEGSESGSFLEEGSSESESSCRLVGEDVGELRDDLASRRC